MLGIVEGIEANPTPPRADRAPVVRENDALGNTIAIWENHHILTREAALLKPLEYAELIRVADVEESAPAIWNRFEKNLAMSLISSMYVPMANFVRSKER